MYQDLNDLEDQLSTDELDVSLIEKDYLSVLKKKFLEQNEKLIDNYDEANMHKERL